MIFCMWFELSGSVAHAWDTGQAHWSCPWMQTRLTPAGPLKDMVDLWWLGWKHQLDGSPHNLHWAGPFVFQQFFPLLPGYLIVFGTISKISSGLLKPYDLREFQSTEPEGLVAMVWLSCCKPQGLYLLCHEIIRELINVFGKCLLMHITGRDYNPRQFYSFGRMEVYTEDRLNVTSWPGFVGDGWRAHQQICHVAKSMWVMETWLWEEAKASNEGGDTQTYGESLNPQHLWERSDEAWG